MWGFTEKIGLDASRLAKFLVRVDGEYFKVPYHNAIHAADVVHGCHFLLASCGADTLLRRGQSAGDALSADLLSFSLILSAAVHDLQHDGYNNR